jgi:septal ring factor EnvC (AmiA/AmiB activator)
MKYRASVWLFAGALALPAFWAQRASAQEKLEPERDEMEVKEAEEAQEHPMLSEKFFDPLEQQLKLKEGQKKTIQAVIDESRGPLQKKSDEMRDMQKKMRELEKKLRALTQDMREKIRALLDNEQKERFDEMMMRMRERMGPKGLRDKPPFDPKRILKEEMPPFQFPPERWEDNPERGRRPREETPQKQRP